MAVKLAHERGMELHAWVWVFAAANQPHNLLLNQPEDYLGPVLSQRHHWAITNRRGEVFDYGPENRKAFLDPANPNVKNYVLSILAEIVNNYDVDGIHLDYIRYPFQDLQGHKTFGYSTISRQKFQELTGVDPITIYPDHHLWATWNDFRIKQVNNFVQTASTIIKQKRPDIIISTAVFAIPKSQRLLTIQQDWETWADNQWVDLIVPMTYVETTSDLEKITQPLLYDDYLESTLILPGIRLLNLPDLVAVDQVQLLRNIPVNGYALFAAENLNGNLETIFNRTQGSGVVTKKQPLPLRQPFQAASIRYQHLQREWALLFANNQLAIAPTDWQEFTQKSEELSKTLNLLAQEPSLKNLLSTQLALSSLRREFSEAMAQHQKTQSYQVIVWSNHLTTIERLLNYGERQIF